MDHPLEPEAQAISTEPLPPEPPPRKRFRVVPFTLGFLAWCVIAAFVVLAYAERHLLRESAAEAQAKDSLNLYMARTQARYLLGTRAWPGAAANSRQLYEQARTNLDVGTVDQRIRFVVMAGELEGPEEALKQIARLRSRLAEKHIQLTSEQNEQLEILTNLYRDYARRRYDAPRVTVAERARLRDELGWFGELALAPDGEPGLRNAYAAALGPGAALGPRTDCPDPGLREEVLVPARRVTLATVLAFVGALGFGLIGFLLLATLIVLAGSRRIQFGLDTGQSPAGVYAETFALWIFLFLGMSTAAAFLPLGPWKLLAGGLAMLLSLVVLLWPRLRGIPFARLREDIGWTAGRNPVLEPAAGVATYLMSLPMLLIGLVMILLLNLVHNWLSGGGPSPDDFTSPPNQAHPVAIYLARGSWGLRLQVFFLACVVAPLVEETMFRGVLYRHLRELTRGVDATVSAVFSAFVSCFIFAVIHPQGVMAVPVLMALAAGFVLAREWRGTLLPAMVAHGLNNGIMLLMGILMLGD
jgi:membrane protease YdiL (CAAX protease family)